MQGPLVQTAVKPNLGLDQDRPIERLTRRLKKVNLMPNILLERPTELLDIKFTLIGPSGQPFMVK